MDQCISVNTGIVGILKLYRFYTPLAKLIRVAPRQLLSVRRDHNDVVESCKAAQRFDLCVRAHR